MPYGTIDGQINSVNVINAANVTTTSTTTVSSGIGVSIGAAYSGRFLLMATVTGTFSVVDTEAHVQIFRLAGGAVPANGTASTGTQVGSDFYLLPSAASVILTTCATIIDSPGIGTWTYYLAYFGNAAGTSTISGTTGVGLTSLTIVEI